MEKQVVNVHDAKTNLSRLLERVQAGERIVIARAGKPIADLVPHTGAPLTFGALAGRVTVDDGAFDWPEPTIEQMFYGPDDPARHA
jgi:prevent-host-death family protein